MSFAKRVWSSYWRFWTQTSWGRAIWLTFLFGIFAAFVELLPFPRFRGGSFLLGTGVGFGASVVVLVLPYYRRVERMVTGWAKSQGLVDRAFAQRSDELATSEMRRLAAEREAANANARADALRKAIEEMAMKYARSRSQRLS